MPGRLRGASQDLQQCFGVADNAGYGFSLQVGWVTIATQDAPDLNAHASPDVVAPPPVLPGRVPDGRDELGSDNPQVFVCAFSPRQ